MEPPKFNIILNIARERVSESDNMNKLYRIQREKIKVWQIIKEKFRDIEKSMNIYESNNRENGKKQYSEVLAVNIQELMKKIIILFEKLINFMIRAKKDILQ